MWDDIIIGEGNKGNTSIKCFETDKFYISQNSVSYWISTQCDDNLSVLNVGLTVFKNTNAGISIEKLIKDKSDNNQIDDYITEIILKNISVNKFNSLITKLIKESLKRGKHIKQKEIQIALGI